VPALQALVADNPLRERLRAHLMHALYRSGRQSDALDVMRDGARTLRELGLQAGPELRAMERMILQQDPALGPLDGPAPPRPLAMPAPPNATIGREEDVTRVVGLLRDPAARLVTLTGPGGVGKSRVACCAVPLAADAFAGGVVHVDLETVEPGPAALAAAAPACASGGRPVLLVLDGAERFAEHAAEVAGLLAADAALTVLATSRVALRLTSEHAVAIGPLAPEPAGELFSCRSAAACPGWDPAAQDPVLVARICARLDRLPLAIELAAAQVAVRSVGELLDRLDDPLATLVDGPLDLPPRHRSLRATLAGSWERLDARERILLGRLSALDGEVSLGAVEHACNADGALGPSAAPLVASLLAKTALVRTDRGEGPRFRVLTTLRAYAIEQAAGVDDLVAVRERHTSLEGVAACA
jgi:predicted ATPase